MDVRIVIGDCTIDLVHLVKLVMSRRRVAIVTGTLALVGGVVTAAAQLDRPEPLQTGTAARAQDINARFDALEQVQERLDGIEPGGGQVTAVARSAIRIETTCATQPAPLIHSDCYCLPNEVAVGGGACTGGACAGSNSAVVETNNGAAFGQSDRIWRISCEDVATNTRVLCVNAHAICLQVAPESQSSM